MTRDLQTVRTELKALRHRFLNGDTSAKPAMEAVAQEAADMYNTKAREVAKRMGVRARLTTADRIMRQGEFLR